MIIFMPSVSPDQGYYMSMSGQDSSQGIMESLQTGHGLRLASMQMEASVNQTVVCSTASSTCNSRLASTTLHWSGALPDALVIV